MNRARLITGARLILGTGAVLAGLNAFFPVFTPPDLPREAQDLLDHLVASGFLTVVSLFNVIFGALLASSVLVPLCLAVLMPIVSGVVLFHFLLAPSGLPLTVLFLALHLYLSYAYRPYFSDVLTLRAKPLL